MIEDALYSRLSQDVALTALIAGRVYTLMAPQNVLTPYLTFQKISHAATGTYCAQDRMTEAVFDFNSYSKTAKQALLVAKAVRDALIDFRGVVDDTYIASIRLQNETSILESEPGLFRVSTSLFIWHGD